MPRPRRYRDVRVSRPRRDRYKERCFAVRLAGGPSSREGRLEILRYGVWGTVCDNGFNDAAAQVACFMLGYG